MGAGHDHHHRHDHGDERRVSIALGLTGSFMLAEAVGGVLSGSLALLADAGHMLTDSAALGLSLYALRVSRRPPTPHRSYGHSRFQILAALINGCTLLAIAAWIVVEAIQRLNSPVEVLAGPMLTVGVLGLIVNIAAFFVLNGGSHSLNLRGAVLHVLGDLLGSVAAIGAAVIILATGWTPIDPILSVLVALLIVRSAWVLVGQSWNVLMEGAPEDLDVDEVRRELMGSVPGLLDVHHVHAWSLTPEKPLLTMHARISNIVDHDQVLRQVQGILADRFSIDHATIQIQRAADDLIETSNGAKSHE